MSAPPPMAGGFSLFPNTSATPRPPSRSQNSKSPARAATPQGRPSVSEELTPPQTKKQSPLRRDSSVREGKRRNVSNNPWQHALDASEPPRQAYPEESVAGPSSAAIGIATTTPDPMVEVTYAQPVSDVPQRCETAFSEAQTLVRSSSQRSRSSIAKPPLAYAPAGQASSSGEGSSEQYRPPQQIRSIFPQFNEELPLDRQEYYPTQASPTHIPQAAISRPLYSPRSVPGPSAEPRSPPNNPAGGAANPVTSPAPTAASAGRWPGQRHYEPAVIPPVSTTEELRALWKVTNGWKASALEGRNFCLKMTASPDAPVYTLSSAQSQPFYSLRVDPTSASALVSLSRYDPNKPFKSAIVSGNSPNNSASSSPTPGSSSHPPSASISLRNSVSVRASKSDRDLRHDAKHWLEVLSTQLEPAIRKQPPNDGLVAHLWPAAAARLVADRANDATTVALAQQESARLVWDADSGNHFLVHPALAMPFCVTVERHPAYSRTEYTLEHLESPVHLAKLTRDGTGAGWLEVDTSIASKIDAVYLVDVVVTALILVAHADEAYTGYTEVFEPPPVLFGGPNGSVMAGSDGRRSSSRSSRRAMGISSRASRREARKEEKEKKKSTKRAKSKKRIEQFEIDLESQDSQYNEFGKSSQKDKEKDKVPSVLRALVWVIKVLFKCLIGSLTLVFKAIGAILSGFARCCGLGKL